MFNSTETKLRVSIQISKHVSISNLLPSQLGEFSTKLRSLQNRQNDTAPFRPVNLRTKNVFESTSLPGMEKCNLESRLRPRVQDESFGHLVAVGVLLVPALHHLLIVNDDTILEMTLQCYSEKYVWLLNSLLTASMLMTSLTVKY